MAHALRGAGWTVDLLHDGIAADLALASEDYALAILDVGLPRLDGFQVLARLRERGKTLPVLMLTARGEVSDRVHGLNLGADDYLAKPFELSELEARVKALLRRSVGGGERQQRCGVLVYDLDARRFSLAEEPLTLTSREQGVLEALIARPGRVMSKDQLAAQVFGLDEDASADAIEIYVYRLRKSSRANRCASSPSAAWATCSRRSMAEPEVAGSLRARLLRRLAILLALLLLFSGWSAYWNGRAAADTAYDRTLLASARAIADGLVTHEGVLRANVPYVALDTFAYDSAGRIYYGVLDIQGRLVSGYENLPAPAADTPRTDDYPALARFYDGEFQGQGVRLVSLLQPVSEPELNGIAEIRVAETLGARERMARSLLTDTLWRVGLMAVARCCWYGWR